MRPLVLLLALAGATEAAAAEYRVITLADGRVMTAEVVATEASGLRVRVPQGETFVPFTNLFDMTPVDEEKYLGQDDWYVFVAADAAYRHGMVATLRAVPHLRVLGDDDAGGVPEDDLVTAARCDVDLECIVDALDSEARWFWVVVGDLDGSDLVLHGAITSGTTRTSVRSPLIDPEGVRVATYEVIQLDAPPAEPVSVVPDPKPKPVPAPAPVRPEPSPRAPLTRRQLSGLAFAPVPGLPSLAQRDYAGFGLAVATVAPVTVAWVGASGKNSQSLPEHLALSIGGFYVATVVANHAFGTWSYGRSQVGVAVAPTEHGGATVLVTGSR